MTTSDILSNLPLKPLWTDNFYFGQPLVGTKYLEIVSKEHVVHNTTYDLNEELGLIMPNHYYTSRTVYQCAEECSIQFLSELHDDEPEQFDSIIHCYENAYNDGINEAGNNLGVICSEIGDTDKGISWFENATKRGSVLAMWNCFTALWNIDRPKACNWLIKISSMERPALNCLFNYAILLHYGDKIEGNTIVCNDMKSQELLEFIRYFKYPNIDETNTVCKIVERLFINNQTTSE